MTPQEIAALAERHWRTFLPDRYSEIENPAAFFAEMGRELHAEILERAEEIVRSRGSTGEWVRNLGQREEARRTAESEVLREKVLLPAEPGSPMDEEVPEPEEVLGRGSTDWMPMSEHRSHDAS